MFNNQPKSLKNAFFMKRSILIPKEYKEELTQELLEINLNREKTLGYILIIVVLSLLILNTIVLRVLNLDKYVFLPFSKLHLLLLLLPMVFLIFYRIKGKYFDKQIFSRLLHIYICIVVLVVCSVIGHHNILINQQPFAYIIAMFCIAPIVILSPWERYLIFLFPYVIYIGKASIALNDQNYLIEVIFFSTLLTALAIFVSSINYNSYVNGYLDNKTILKMNEQLNSMYKDTEDALKDRSLELNEAIEYEKLRTAFFANISHEIRTPLNVILSAEQMIRVKLEDIAGNSKKEEVNHYMNVIKQNSNRLVRIINNLLDITKLDAECFTVNLKNWDIVRVVEDICLGVAKYIQDRDIELIFDTDVEEKIVACDADKIERIMLNLLSNAVKFTPVGGSIYVNLHEKENKVLIIVKDTGIGIPMEKKDWIFEMFVQVDKTTTRSREGSGIGLSIVKSLVEMHDGSIRVICEQGKGSEFIIEIPDKTIPDLVDKQEIPGNEFTPNIDKINIEFSDIY